MAGRLLRVVEVREFNFNDTASNSTANIVAVQHIDVSWAREITMAARWHSGSIGTNATVSVIALPDGHTDEDPAQVFEANAAAGQIDITSSDTAPFYATELLGEGTDAPTGPMISIFVAGAQPTTTVNVDPKLSIDLLLRD